MSRRKRALDRLQQFDEDRLVSAWLSNLQLSSRSDPFGPLPAEDNKKVISDVVAHLPQLHYLLDPSLQSTDDDDDDDDEGQQSAAGRDKVRWTRTHHKERTELAQYAFLVLDQAAARFKPKVGGGPIPTSCRIAEAKAPLSIAQGIAYLQRPFPVSEIESSRLDPTALQRAAEDRWSRQVGTPKVLRYEDVLVGLINMPILGQLLVGCSPAAHARPAGTCARCSLHAPMCALCVVLTGVEPT